MTTKVEIPRHQQFYFDIEDVQEYRPTHLEAMVQFLKRYQQILVMFFQHSPDESSNLFHNGLEKLLTIFDL